MAYYRDYDDDTYDNQLEFYEHLGNADFGTDEDLDAATEEAEPMDTPAPATASSSDDGFRERLDDTAKPDGFEDDFTRSLDPSENPHLSDQLDDTDLQHDGNSDYR